MMVWGGRMKWWSTHRWMDGENISGVIYYVFSINEIPSAGFLATRMWYLEISTKRDIFFCIDFLCTVCDWFGYFWDPQIWNWLYLNHIYYRGIQI